MASRCENCGRGSVAGHNVSHAKNRTKRYFRPNLQSLKAIKNGIAVRVVFCARCIQRLKKFGNVGNYFRFKYAAVPSADIQASLPSHKHIDREHKKIEEIMKKEEEKWKEKAEEEKATAEKKKKEKMRIEELVGKK